jgi:hypothetical protein
LVEFDEEEIEFEFGECDDDDDDDDDGEEDEFDGRRLWRAFVSHADNPVVEGVAAAAAAVEAADGGRGDAS